MTLAPNHKELLDGSTVSAEAAEARGYWTATTKRELRDIGFPPSQQLVPALVIPVFDVKGELATYQIRPDRPRLNEASKPRKYEMKARDHLVIDVPPPAREWLKDRERPLFVTEGSRKADAMVSAGLCAIALLGVWAWRDSDGLLADWEYIGLKERKVYVVFDSDVMEKAGVHLALARVRAVLEHRGANVRLVYLPPGEGAAKVGVDDYLAAGNTVKDLLGHATSELRGAPSEPQPDPPPYVSRNLADVLTTVRAWMHLPDPGPLYAVLAAYVANRYPGPPVWLLLVGPPSSGKTELLHGLGVLPDVHLAATLTEGSLLSGTATRERAAMAKGGLLREIGAFGYIVMKDFTSVLAINRDTRGTVLAALREVFDGEWTRHVGVDGGKTLHWAGKVGVVAGVTPAIDGHHAVMAALGERFLLYRLPEVAEERVAETALRQSADGEQRRRAISEAIAGLLTNIDVPGSPPELTTEETTYLVTLARLTVRARSAVERDSGANKEITLIPEPESPARFAQELHRLWGAAQLIGLSRTEAWTVARHVAVSSMPALRRRVLEDVLLDSPEHLRTAVIAREVGHPTNTTLRALEDLWAHHLVDRRTEDGKDPGSGIPYEWAIVQWAADALLADPPIEISFTSPFPQNPPHGVKGNVVPYEEEEGGYSSIPLPVFGERYRSEPATACAYVAHRGSEWNHTDGRVLCGVCHPAPPGVAV